jgi:hypothetical protein
MKKITSAKLLKEFPYPHIQKIGDLLFFEQPLCSLLTHHGSFFILRWVELDAVQDLSRWLFFKISYEQLIQYLKKEISDFDLIQSAMGAVLLLDIEDAQTYQAVWQVLPATYLPARTAFFETKLCPDLHKISKILIHNKPITPNVLNQTAIAFQHLFNNNLNAYAF